MALDTEDSSAGYEERLLFSPGILGKIILFLFCFFPRK